jgi:hypothetical protein
MSENIGFAACVESIESAYEFMLAYAAQGRDKEGVGGDGPSIRNFLTGMSAALAHVEHAAKAKSKTTSADNVAQLQAYVDVLGQDAKRAKAAVDLALSVPVITSQLVDNLNASIHLRACLTSMFLMDEALKLSKVS